MKLLAGLTIAQAVMLGFLAYQIIRIDARTNEIVAAGSEIAAAKASENSKPLRSAARKQELSGEEVRQIIREEIASVVATEGGQQRQLLARAGSSSGAASKREYDPAEVAPLLSSVQRDFDFFIGQGRMGDKEMAAFQQKMASLPPHERREMLSKLAKAINSGTLDARM